MRGSTGYLLVQIAIELQFIYPIRYPESTVDVHLRTYLPRECHQKFNESLQQFLNKKTLSTEPYVMEFLSWLQDNEDLFLACNDAALQATTEPSTSKKIPLFARLWIYSHHIYSIEKRRHIVDWAHQLHLSGFSLPGKPGIICVEGDESNVDEYWTRLRALNWKKLQIKEKESLGPADDEGRAKQSRFERFHELECVHDSSGKGDFGQFYQYLQDRQLERMFNLYFGFSGTDKK